MLSQTFSELLVYYFDFLEHDSRGYRHEFKVKELEQGTVARI